MTLSLLRAALVAALSISSVLGFAQGKNSKSETYKDIIQKAYNLSLQRDRVQALNILSSALQRETRAPAQAEIKKTMQDISTVFFSDKAQAIFEISVSLRKTDINQAQDKINEASRIEPDNFTILNEQARLHIAKGDCRAAQENIRKFLLLVPFDEELKLSMAQAWTCQGKWIEYQKIADTVAIKKSSFAKYWYALEVEKNIDLRNYAKALENLNNIKKIDEKYPELAYWTWKWGQAQKKAKSEDAQKYVMACKNISANHYRQYMIDPMLCRRVSDVESELKGINGTSE